MAERVLLIKTVRPALFNKFAFHVGSLLATLSTNGCRSLLASFLNPSRIPRYRIGKGSIFAGKFVSNVTVASKSHCIGEIKHLATLVLSPEALAKMSKDCGQEHEVELYRGDKSDYIIGVHVCSFLDLGVKQFEKAQLISSFQQSI